MNKYNEYLSPFTWRYGSKEMRKIWSENVLRITWRRIWVTLAETEMEFGLVNQTELDDLKAHQHSVDIEKSLEIEKEIHHDLMAEVTIFSEQCKTGGRIIHFGATSMDIKDNADVLRIKEALEVLIPGLKNLLKEFAAKIDETKSIPVIAFTHLQPAEPSTLGYRLALTAQDLLADLEEITRVFNNLKAKGIRGAVGTGASFIELIGKENLEAFENSLSEKLGVGFYPIVSQTYPRKQDLSILNALMHLGASISKFAFDLRVLQNPTIGELGEPFGSRQVGSSAMPFKRNPIRSEKINSLARLLAQYPRTAWDNAANSLLERTLDDSANRRSILPEAFLAADELINVTTSIISGLQIYQAVINANLEIYGPFAATERVMMALTKAGGDRQILHEHIRKHSMAAWKEIQQGQPNPLIKNILNDSMFLDLLPERKLSELLEFRAYTGDAEERCLSIIKRIQTEAN